MKAMARENSSLVLNCRPGEVVGSRLTNTVTLTPDLRLLWPRPVYTRGALVSQLGSSDGGIVNTYRTVMVRVDHEEVSAILPENGVVTARYRPVLSDNAAEETATVDALEFDLTKGYAESIVSGSARWRLGNSTYIHQAGQVYRDPSPATGAGSFAGSLSLKTGKVRLTEWTSGGSNAITLDALTTQVGSQPIDEAIFRTASSPIKPGTLQLRWQDCLGASFSKTPDATGELEDDDCHLIVDFVRGQVHVRFGKWRTAASVTDAEKKEPWFSVSGIVQHGGVDSIWQGHPAVADTILYNAVASTSLPPDSALLGVDAARLPPDGKALIYRRGMMVLVHHTASINIANLVAGAVHDCGRTRLYRVVIEDSTGKRLPADQYTVDRVTGLVTLADPLDQSGYTAPWKLYHTIADLRRVRDTDINGALTLLKPLSYNFPSGSRCSGVLYIGTLQARVSNVFARSTWSGNWSSTTDSPLYGYADNIYPLVVTDAGAYPDEYLIQFTSTTAFRLIGKNLGVIAIGDINTDFAPVNPLTGQPYVSIDSRGWGLGWATGGCLRFTIHAACYPIACVRAVQPSDPTETADRVELLLTGNVDE
jgi:hypothetical protein